MGAYSGWASASKQSFPHTPTTKQLEKWKKLKYTNITCRKSKIIKITQREISGSSLEREIERERERER
jgi:hypothetical protein